MERDKEGRKTVKRGREEGMGGKGREVEYRRLTGASLDKALFNQLTCGAF